MKFFNTNKYFNNNHLNYRFFILLSIIFLSLSIILIRMSFLQLISTKQLIYESNLRSSKIEIEPNNRGTIRDRNGNLLAINIPVNNVYIDPKLFFLKKKLFR